MNPPGSSGEINDQNPVFGAVILAAGAATRMGFAKQLLDFQGRSLIAGAVQSAIDAGCHPVVVVLGAHAEKVRPELAPFPVTIAYNADWELGMGTSIATGVRRMADLPHPIGGLLVMLCDQPLIKAADFRKMIRLKRDTGALIVSAAYSGQLGAPAVFDRDLLPSLLQLDGQTGAKKLFHQFRDKLAAYDLPAAVADLDTPEDVRNIQ